VAPDLEDIREARRLISEVVDRTPVVSSRTLSRDIGGHVVLKAENLQQTGSFKIRGATNKLASLGDDAVRGVTTGSAGNHAQALAFAARHFGVPCEIFVPVGAAITKIDACRALGATVVEHGAALAEAVRAAKERANRERSVWNSWRTSPISRPWWCRSVAAG
jgi:threonine dehydratase